MDNAHLNNIIQINCYINSKRQLAIQHNESRIITVQRFAIGVVAVFKYSASVNLANNEKLCPQAVKIHIPKTEGPIGVMCTLCSYCFSSFSESEALGFSGWTLVID